MNFNHVKLNSLDFDLKATTTENGRRYATPDGKMYPSITTVLGFNKDKKKLFEWRKRVGEEEANRITKKSAGRGTKLHSVCESYLLNEMNDMKISTMMPDIKDFFMQLKPYIDECVGDVYGLEQSLYSHRLRIAGRTDCIAEWEGKLSIIDYKNSIREKKEDFIQDYFIQCTGYAEMFTEITGRPIDQIVVAIANEEGKPQIFKREKSKYVAELQRYVGKYWINELTKT